MQGLGWRWHLGWWWRLRPKVCRQFWSAFVFSTHKYEFSTNKNEFI
jgi:hypothetical protein